MGLLVAQRKLESIRLLDELLERVKVAQNIKGDVKNSEKDLFKTAKLASKLSKKSDITGLIEKDRDEAELRNKLVSKLKEKEIEKMNECDKKLRTILSTPMGRMNPGKKSAMMNRSKTR